MNTIPSQSQIEADYDRVFRAYEAAHKIWMSTSVYTEAGREAKRIKDEARAAYDIAARAMFTTAT